MSFKDFIKRILTGAPAPTVKREIIVNAEALETRVAVLEDGRLEDFQVEHPSEERLVGSIYKGRIQNLENDLQAAFVDIGLRKNAFLHYWDMNPDDESLLDDDEDDAGEEDGDQKGKDGARKRKGGGKRLSNEEIADRLYISPHTVRRHLQNIMEKTGFGNRLDLAMNAKRIGLVVSEEDRRNERRKPSEEGVL